jgi:hypothetical protein
VLVPEWIQKMRSELAVVDEDKLVRVTAALMIKVRR